MTTSLVLVVDDDESVLNAIAEILKLDGHIPIIARSGEEALSKLATIRPSLVIMDIAMPKLDGIETLKRIKQLDSSIPVILITGFGTMQMAIKAMQLGAFDYLTKPLDPKKLREAASLAIGTHQTLAIALPGQSGNHTDRYAFVGKSPKMQEIYKLIGSISTTPNHASVLILGESGTGKELVARAIHNSSAHADEPFVAVNCTVLQDSLLESELFGHEKGAFTGAFRSKKGKFEYARRGTIFLDEIGDITPDLQRKLLRVLQERQFERLGGNEAIDVHARFIAATNRDLSEEVRKERFRKDLFYRLNVLALHLPPLQDRTEDIPILAFHFLEQYASQFKRSIRGFSQEAMTFLQSQTYPGNVRELGNLIERAVMITTGNVILPEALNNAPLLVQAVPDSLPIVSQDFGEARDHVLQLFERQFLIKQLLAYDGNVTLAAKAAHMTRQNFQRLMKRNNIKAEDYRDT